VTTPWAGRRRPQLADEVVLHVRALIMSGAVEQGSFLRLDGIAKDLRISATPVREAMAALEREGLVRLQPRRGYVVSRFIRQDVADIFMVEAYVASELAARAAQQTSPERLAELHATYEKLRSFIAAEDYEQADYMNFRFYWLVHDAARSPKLAWLASTIVPYSPYGYTSNVMLRAVIVEGHGRVLEAITGHDSVIARSAMSEYVRHVGDHIIQQYDQAGLWTDEDPKSEEEL
jgi:DNA-binding GntR family transcriptional regulator